MTKYKVGTPHKRKSKKVQCSFCGEWYHTRLDPQNFVCYDCKEFFKREMSEQVHETAKMFRRDGGE